MSTKSSDVGGQPASQGPIWCETPHPFMPGTIGAEKFENVNEPVDDASAPDTLKSACGTSVNTSLSTGWPGAGQIFGQDLVPVPAAIATSTCAGLLQDMRAVKVLLAHSLDCDVKMPRSTPRTRYVEFNVMFVSTRHCPPAGSTVVPGSVEKKSELPLPTSRSRSSRPSAATNRCLG